MPGKDCPFCNLSDDQIVASNDLALAICDNFPVSPGHMLFIPRRHDGKLRADVYWSQRYSIEPSTAVTALRTR